MSRRRLVLAALPALVASIAMATTAAASAATSPLRTASVRSFDGTVIHVNFFSAVGLRAGHRAPTVMMGPRAASASRVGSSTSTTRSTRGATSRR